MYFVSENLKHPVNNHGTPLITITQHQSIDWDDDYTRYFGIDSNICGGINVCSAVYRVFHMISLS